MSYSKSYIPNSRRAYHYRSRKIALHNNDRCEICGSDTCLHVHHINGNWKDNDISNLAVLCKEHHLELHRV